MLLVILQKSLIASMVVLESGENLANNCNIVFKFSCWLLIVAIRDFCNITNNINENYQLDHAVPFSSEKKWSGISLKNKGSYVLGAPEFVLKEQFNKYKNEILSYQENYRVLSISHSNNKFENNDLPQN